MGRVVDQPITVTGRWKRVLASDRGEIAVSELDACVPGELAGYAEPGADALAQTFQHIFQLSPARYIGIERGLGADRPGLRSLTQRCIINTFRPALYVAGIIGPERSAQGTVIGVCQFAEGGDVQFCQRLASFWPDAGEIPDGQRSKERLGLVLADLEYAVGLGMLGRYLGDQFAGSDADRYR